MARKRFKSYAECEQALSRAEDDATAYHRALVAVMAGDVVWRKFGDYRAGHCGQSEFTDGYAVVVWSPEGQRPSTRAECATAYADREERTLNILAGTATDNESRRAVCTFIRGQVAAGHARFAAARSA